MTVIGEAVVARAASASCQWLLPRAESVLPVSSLLTVCPPSLSVSPRPLGVAASLLPETVLVSLPPVLMARYERYRNKPTPTIQSPMTRVAPPPMKAMSPRRAYLFVAGGKPSAFVGSEMLSPPPHCIPQEANIQRSNVKYRVQTAGSLSCKLNASWTTCYK
jgi:hypothetical protein